MKKFCIATLLCIFTFNTIPFPQDFIGLKDSQVVVQSAKITRPPNDDGNRPGTL